MIGRNGERGSRISVLAARQDDVNNDVANVIPHLKKKNKVAF